jgi:Zn-dependent peptidase ImmA (M78 family)/transcriptional regulator with XRE-family HTH domain
MRQGTRGFIGERLKQVREARDLSAAALADLLNVTRASIYQYEGNLQSPSPEALRLLGDKLRVDVQYFLRPMPNRQSGVRFYRCMATATKRARVRAGRRYEWVREICDCLNKYVRFPAVRFPDLGVPRDPARISFEDVEEAASQTRIFFGLPDGPVPNVLWTLENHGAITAKFDLDATTLDAFSEWSPADQRPYVILSSDKGSAVRSRFDAAHELGHLILHRNTPESFFCHKDSFELMENQAHRFASAFLLPESAFTSALYAPTLDAFRSLKETWRVAIAAMIMRVHDLNIVNDEGAKRLWINLGRRKWRTREPLDDRLQPEAPRYLSRCISVLLERRTIAPCDLQFQTGIPAQDIEKLIGLPAGTLADAPLSVDPPTPCEDDEDFPSVLRFPNAS